jgi:glutamine synthetase
MGRSVAVERANMLVELRRTNDVAWLTMAEAMLVFAPHANSWRRFASQSYAPVSPTWGVNNRSVALRVPAGDIKARRIEHRPAGVDANPYLVATAVLAGIRHGWAHSIDPGPQVTGNGYADAPDAPPMPADWRQAIEAARSSTFLQEALGTDMHRTFLAVLQAEQAQVMRRVPDVDFDLYLHTV